jgi:uncharacterized YigZ family protein
VIYQTLSGESSSQYRVLGSRHIGKAYHVKSEEEIKIVLDRLRKEHHDATHVCYAWRLGWDKSRYRINDDGEPSGTAGKPIYGQILSRDLTNVFVAVVRYYGGTKLGTGGLIDAYKTAAAAAIDEGTIIQKPVMDLYELKFSYEHMPLVMKKLKELDMEKVESKFEETCTLKFLMSYEHGPEITSWVEGMSGVELLHLDRL